ncbi:MAG: autotransporter domain-containing protein [Thermoanaerobaculia bacterium]
MDLVEARIPRAAGVALSVFFVAATSVHAFQTQIAFNPVTQFSAAEAGGAVTVSVSISTDEIGCNGDWSIDGDLDFAASAGGGPNPATAGSDFVAGPIKVTGLAGSATRPAAIQLDVVVPGVILDDALDEPDETFILAVTGGKLVVVCGGPGTLSDSSPVGGPATITVTDDDLSPPTPVTIQLGSAALSVDETAGSVIVPVTRSPTVGKVKAHYRVTAGSAEAGDFTAVSDVELVFDEGSATPQSPLVVQVFGDADLDDDTVVVELFNPQVGGGNVTASLGSPSSATVTLHDTSAGETIRETIHFSVASASVSENAGSYTVAVTREPSDGVVRVSYRVALGTAEPGDVTTVDSGTLEFADGSSIPTTPLVVQIFPDADTEDERVDLSLSSPSVVAGNVAPEVGSPSALALTISESAPVVEDVVIHFGAASLAIGEGGSSIDIPVTRDSPHGAVSVGYDVRAESAEASDFEVPGGASGTISFAEGSLTPSQPLAIKVVVDADRDDETLSIALRDPVLLSSTGGTLRPLLGSPAVATLAILEPGSTPPPPPPPPSGSTVSFAESGRTVDESAGTVAVHIRRSGDLSADSALRLRLGGTASPGADFAPPATDHDLPAGVAEISVPIAIVDDLASEGDETITLEITNVKGGVGIGSPSLTTLRIAANDRGGRLAPTETLPASVAGGSELALRVHLEHVDGSAWSGATLLWSLAGERAAEATLASGERVTTDAEGDAVQRIRFGPTPGDLEVAAAVEGIDGVSAHFRFAVEQATLPPPPPGVPESPVAPAVNRLCGGADAAGNPLCDYLFNSGLSAAEQLVAAEELSARQLTAPTQVALAAAGEQIGNLAAHLTALRGGGARQSLQQISASWNGRPFAPQWVSQAVAGERRAESFRRVMDRALDAAGRSDRALDAVGRGRSAAATTAPAPRAVPRWGIFANGRVSFGSRDATAREDGFDFRTDGLTVGVDRRFGARFIGGGALGFARTASDLDADRGGLQSQGRSLSLFGLYQSSGSFYLQGTGTLGTTDFDLERRIRLPRRAEEIAKSSSSGNQVSLSLEAGAGRERGAWTLTGYGRVAWAQADVDGFRERGSGGSGPPLAPLAVAAQRFDSLLAQAGIDAGYTWQVRWGLLRPVARLAILHEFADDAQVVRARLLVDPDPADVFFLPTDAPDRDFASVGLGLRAQTFFGVMYLLVDREVGRSDLATTTISFGFRREF